MQSQSNRIPIFLPLNREAEASRGGDAVIAGWPHGPPSSPPATSVPSGIAEHRGQGWQREQSRSSGVRRWFDEAFRSVCLFDCHERDGSGVAGGKLRSALACWRQSFEEKLELAVPIEKSVEAALLENGFNAERIRQQLNEIRGVLFCHPKSPLYSKYAFLGALRSAAQMVLYEVSIGLILIVRLVSAFGSTKAIARMFP
nr:orf34 [Ipomoea batatas]